MSGPVQPHCLLKPRPLLKRGAYHFGPEAGIGNDRALSLTSAAGRGISPI